MVHRIVKVLIGVGLGAVVFGLMSLLLSWAGPAASELATLSTIAPGRGLEPVAIKGVHAGVPVSQVFVYRQVGGGWEQISFQIDEVLPSGGYVALEDGLMDENDEVVFMAQDLGQQATAAITSTLPISDTWVEIEVTDPLAPANKGWAYVVRSAVLTQTSTLDRVEYISDTHQVSATNHTLGWATDHAGLNHQTLFGGNNILDRTKLRVTYTVFGTPIHLTEDDLPAPALNLIKDGPVRVIVERGGATTFAYASYVQTETVIDLTSYLGTLNEIRTSTDLTSTVTGTYYSENASAGLTIDGSPEAAPTMLSKAWRQISLDGGTVIQVVDLGAIGGTKRHYYRDDSAVDPGDTGDGMSFGDAGVHIADPGTKYLTTLSAQYMLPGKQANRGDEFYGYFQSPLLVAARRFPSYCVYLPLVTNAAE